MRICSLLISLFFLAGFARADTPDLTIERIFASPDLSGPSLRQADPRCARPTSRRPATGSPSCAVVRMIAI